MAKNLRCEMGLSNGNRESGGVSYFFHLYTHQREESLTKDPSGIFDHTSTGTGTRGSQLVQGCARLVL